MHRLLDYTNLGPELQMLSLDRKRIHDAAQSSDQQTALSLFESNGPALEPEASFNQLCLLFFDRQTSHHVTVCNLHSLLRIGQDPVPPEVVSFLISMMYRKFLSEF